MKIKEKKIVYNNILAKNYKNHRKGLSFFFTINKGSFECNFYRITKQQNIKKLMFEKKGPFLLRLILVEIDQKSLGNE